MFAELISLGIEGAILAGYCKTVGSEPSGGPCIYTGDMPVGGYCGSGLDPIGGTCYSGGAIPS